MDRPLRHRNVAEGRDPGEVLVDALLEGDKRTGKHEEQRHDEADNRRKNPRPTLASVDVCEDAAPPGDQLGQIKKRQEGIECMRASHAREQAGRHLDALANDSSFGGEDEWRLRGPRRQSVVDDTGQDDEQRDVRCICQRRQERHAEKYGHAGADEQQDQPDERALHDAARGHGG